MAISMNHENDFQNRHIQNKSIHPCASLLPQLPYPATQQRLTAC